MSAKSAIARLVPLILKRGAFVMFFGMLVVAFWFVGTPIVLRHAISLLPIVAVLLCFLVTALLGTLVSYLWPAVPWIPLFLMGEGGLLISLLWWCPHTATAAWAWWVSHARSHVTAIFRGAIILSGAGMILPLAFAWVADHVEPPGL